MPHEHVDVSTLRVCRPRNPIVGKRFGKLLVVKYIGHAANVGLSHASYYECLCDCGATKIQSRQRLVEQKAVACQACLIKTGAAHHAWKGHEGISSILWGRYLREAKRRRLVFEVSIESAWAIFSRQEGKCALTGLPISLPKKYALISESTASFDRIDSSKGYIEGNMQWVHKAINHIKSNTPNDIFVLMCHLVAKNNPTQLTSEYFHDNYRPLMNILCNVKKAQYHSRSKIFHLLFENGETKTVIGLHGFCHENKYSADALRRTLKTGRFYRGMKVVSIETQFKVDKRVQSV